MCNSLAVGRKVSSNNIGHFSLTKNLRKARLSPPSFNKKQTNEEKNLCYHLNGIGDVRNHLDGFAQIISAPLFVYHMLINLA
jgi:hypothetical protein